MPLTRTDKEAAVDDIRATFDRAIAAVLVDFRGMDVETITELRARFREAGVEYRVVKNNLVRKAIVGTELEGLTALDDQLKGPTGIAWSFEDPSSAAKILKEFRKAQPDDAKIAIKGGVLEGKFLDGGRVEAELAALPGKNEIRAMLLAQLLAPAQNLVRQLNAPGQNLALVLDAYRREKESA